MKVRPESRPHRQLRILSILLVVVAVVAAMTGCVAILYTLTLSSTVGGSVTEPGEGVFTYSFCTEVSLVATPDSGYRFVNWTGDVQAVVDVNAPSTIITSMNANYVIVANFEPIPPGQVSLIASSSAGGSVTIPGEGMFLYQEGTVVNLVATADTGYRFVSWTGDVGTIANVNLPLSTIKMDGNYVIRANFEQIPAGQFSLTASSTGGGSVTTPGEGTFLYAAGTVVNLVATADTGYRFVSWTGDVGTIANVNLPLSTIKMDGNYVIRANFEQIPAGQFSLTASSTGGGSVTTPGEGTFLYAAGTVVNLVAAADTGYRFVSWTGDVGTIANVNLPLSTIKMDGNYVIRANFEQIPAGQFSLTASSTGGGSVTTPGEGTFLYAVSTVVNLVATADTGYRFVSWTGDVGTIDNVNLPLSTIKMDGNYVIRANFEQIPAGQFSLTASSTGGGSVTTPGEGTFLYAVGTLVNLVATADTGYRFVNWTGDVDTVANVNLRSTTITMNGNYVIRADFAPVPSENGLPPGVVVGLTGHPVNKLAVMMPWIIIGVVILGGASLLLLRRRRA
jgi:hypothetical protein